MSLNVVCFWAMAQNCIYVARNDLLKNERKGIMRPDPKKSQKLLDVLIWPDKNM